VASTHDVYRQPGGKVCKLVVSLMTQYLLAALAGMWLADGIALLLAPRYIISQIRELLQHSPLFLRWEFLAIVIGLFLFASAQALNYQWLWVTLAVAMIIKGAVLSMAPPSWQRPIIDWCLERDDIDYRFWGLGLCTLAILLLHALGWLGQR